MNQGRPVGQDSLTLMRHLRKCVGIDETEVEAPQVGAALVAITVAAVLERFPSLAGECAHLLANAGLHEAALIVQATIPETMRQALISTAGSPAGELLEAQVFAKACRNVLPGHATVVREIAADLTRQGAQDLADACRR